MRYIVAISILFFAAVLLFPRAAASGEVSLTLNVIVPATTPSDAQIFIVGDDTTIGAWKPDRIRLRRITDSTWQGVFSFPQEKTIEFKITRGTWETEAIYVDETVPQNFRLQLLRDTVVTLRPVSWRDLIVVPPTTGGITGTVRRHDALAGTGLNYTRDITVWLPPSYDTETGKRYPVLYMHDGQNVFDPSTSFTRHDWRVDEISDSLIRAGRMEELIVVAINNTSDRSDEYHDTPLGEKYRRFIIDVVKHLVDSTYRTKPDRENTGTMGSSSGGLCAFLMAWKHPEVFSKAGCVSPAFFPRVLDMVRTGPVPPYPVKLYIDLGTLGIESELLPDCEEMVKLLPEKGFVDGKNMLWFHDIGAEHNEKAWSNRLWRPLLFLFGR